MADLASGAEWLTPGPPPPPPTEVPRENIRVLMQALGLRADDVRELLIAPTQMTVQTVVRDEHGVVMRDGLPLYSLHTVQIIEPKEVQS